ncbi:DUF4157 domain-containing protein [Actinotalea sp. M2MS4P-6]|uniref:eCIS core domain-containing protein n=1 Tax=Actinotalea sp. M2MS4P-6 TaxID=2983762 RepID=UPI0021E42E4C|nr:DUF4157 domain-containing protein [Actinotalea sp. M2MS4P-6]MCV2395179.1 DUF4157 domain-containing protein [Actinotalea sp. M2MS4P-6]
MSRHRTRVPVPALAQHETAPESGEPAPTDAGPASPVPIAGLTVGHADDPAEHAADRMADQALARLRRTHDRGHGDTTAEGRTHAHDDASIGDLRRSTAPTPEATIGPEGGELDADGARRIEAARGGGAPLPGAVRRRMETGFGANLGHVRVHDGPAAGRLSASMGAEAFTTGRDIFFGAGRYEPGTPGGDQVLAHEIAHVLAEPGSIRRLTRPFKKKTPQEQAANAAKAAQKQQAKDAKTAQKQQKKDAKAAEKQQKKAAKAAQKQQEKQKAARVKQSKTTEKAELKGLKESRKAGEAGRAALTADVYDTANDAQQVVAGKVNAAGHVPMAQSGPQQRAASLNSEFEQALQRERAVFDDMTANNVGSSDTERAELAYHQVWYTEFPQLTPVRPPRETAAERLVIQVRHARAEADADASAKEVDEATLKVRMLPSAVEQAYERMVTHRNDLMEKDPTGSEALAQDDAWEAVRQGMSPKELAGFPPRDSPLDMAAWKQAEDRVEARDKQKARDAATIEANLALLPETQRIGPQLPGRGTGTTEKAEKVEDVGKKLDLGKTGVNAVGGGIAGFVGKGQDKDLRDAQGVTKEKEFTTYLPGAVDQGIGEAVRQGKRADKQIATGQREYVPQTLPTSDATKAKEGIGQVTGILSSLMSAVTSGFQMVDAIEKSWDSKDPYEALRATKAGATGLNGLVGAAKESANLAKLIDSSVADGVKAVVPGLDIASSALGMVSGITEVAAAGMRQRETDLTMFEARAGSTDKVNVMVYPLMKVSQVYTKHLEQKCWSLGVTILNFSASVAQVASAGGFGIPAAIKAATAVIDNLHKIAHYIASKVLNAMAKTAEKESAVMHLEGGAEDELRRHPKMAVDGIILKAAAGDPTALLFLSSYRIDGKPITADYVKRIKPKPVKPFDPTAKKTTDTEPEQTSDDALLLKIRDVVLKGMDTNADPQSVFEDLKKKAGPVTDKLSDAKGAWKESGELATARNTQAANGKLGDNTKTNRGLGWRIRMIFATEKRGKLTERTAAHASGEALPAGVACAVGDLQLPDQADPPAIARFVESLTVEALEAELKRTPRRNSPEWIDFLREALREKIMAAALAANNANLANAGGAGGP